MSHHMPLPSGVTVFERGWLSANNILLIDSERTALVDSGYATHADQTVRLVQDALGTRQLDLLINTHLHSDHCGGNAALQAAHPQMQTHIPPGQAAQVAEWNPVALTYIPTGQICPAFRYDDTLNPGQHFSLAEIHAAPGHDPHSVILFEPESRTLISADALWEKGFGVVFPELEGADAFAHVGQTLDLIESLAPRTVIPGHGPVFSTVSDSLDIARRRLDRFVQNPAQHIAHASKVLVKFKVLECQRISEPELHDWAKQTPYIRMLHQQHLGDFTPTHWFNQVLEDLIRSGAIQKNRGYILNS
jgi:glyoxylase-like metal-dependent hydrolase (beta-lactamase superfamily II)